MSTYTQLLVASFGAGQTGQVSNIGYRVIDSGGTTQIARTNTGVSEETDAAGNATTGIYKASSTFNSAWVFPVRVVWDITGQAGVATEEIIGSEYKASAALGVTLDMTQAVPTTNTANAIGDCLNAARAQGFGKWVFSGTTLTLYAADGTTVVRIFTLNSSTVPTSRI